MSAVIVEDTTPTFKVKRTITYTVESTDESTALNAVLAYEQGFTRNGEVQAKLVGATTVTPVKA